MQTSEDRKHDYEIGGSVTATARKPRLLHHANSYRRAILFLLFTCFCLALPLAANTPKAQRAERQQTEVLFLSFSDPDLPDIEGLIEEAETQLVQNRTTPIHFTLEYVDPFLVDAAPARKERVLSFLKEKYQRLTFDLVITIGDLAPTLGEQNLSSLFPGLPLLFCVVSPSESLKWARPVPGRTGVVRNLNYLPTLQLALAQNPRTRQVVVIAGSSEFEKAEMKAARDEFRSYEPNISFQYWTDLRLTDLKGRLSNVANDTIVLFLDFALDADGEQFVPSRVLPSLHEAANRPMYGTMASFVGRGVVGGSVADLRQVGRIVGQDGSMILNGQKPETIPVHTAEFQRNVFDWRELNRWHIAADRVPAGSSVLYWEYSPWELYRWKILGLLAALALETLLISLLLRNRSIRRRAEEALALKKGELLEAQRLSRIGSWQWDSTRDALSCSDELLAILGTAPSLAPRSLEDLHPFFTRENRERLIASVQESLRSNKPFELESEAFRADQNELWLTIRGEAIQDRSGIARCIRGTMQDITDRKRAQEVNLSHSVILDSSDDAIVSTTVDGIITNWNSGAQHTFGFSQAEALGQPIAILIPSDQMDEANMIARHALAGEQISHRETVRLRKDGKKIFVSLTTSPLRDAAGKIIGISRVTRDITKNKQTELELRKSEQKFSTIFRQGPMAMTLMNAKTQRYIDVNETFERVTGYKQEELIGRTPFELGIWAEPSESSKFAETLLSEGRLRDIEFRFVTKDGRTRTVTASAELIEIDGEQCVLGAAIDITDRKRAEQALVESEKRFRVMADSAPVLMWMSGTDGICADFNSAWLRFTGRTIEQESGDGWTHGVHPDDLQPCLRGYASAFEARKSFALEFRLLRHDGQYRWILDKGVPRFLESGEFAGYIGCCIDITEQKEAKAVQAELSGRLMHAHEEERARIARELHDDINQRLALLANGIQELEHGHESDAAPQVREQLHGFWKQTSEIAMDLQHLSHQLHPSKLHYLGLAAATRGLCQEFSKLHRIEVDCVVRDLPRNLDHEISLCLFRTVQESLHNVAKHSQAHLVKVELTGEPSNIKLRISDDGVGFTYEPTKHGQGLGLVSMQERLKLLGGTLSVWSRPSLGTQIEANVPLSAKYAQIA